MNFYLIDPETEELTKRMAALTVDPYARAEAIMEGDFAETDAVNPFLHVVLVKTFEASVI